MLTKRQKKLLKTIINEHIKTSQPVGSQHLIKKIGYSSATIRNEMNKLTKEGFLYQPHISAGRIPTEKAYRYFIENLISKKEPSNNIKRIIKKYFLKRKLERIEIKELTRKLSELTRALVILVFNKNDFYYTGFSFLFSQPEFKEKEIYNLSVVIDRLDRILKDLLKEIKEEPLILIGKENPFSELCSLILFHLKSVIIGILGPMRMDYQKILAIMNYLKKITDYERRTKE
jgi:heat-inducible transcriptional repressor